MDTTKLCKSSPRVSFPLRPPWSEICFDWQQVRVLQRSGWCIRNHQHNSGFSLIEVVIAISVLAVAILTLLGMFAPTMRSVDRILNYNDVAALTSQIDTVLQTDDFEFNTTNGSKISFAEVSNWANGGKVLYFWNTLGVDSSDALTPAEMMVSDAKGQIAINTLDGAVFVVVISQAYLGSAFDYTTDYDAAAGYVNEGYVPFTVSIYALDFERVNSFGNGQPAVNSSGLVSQTAVSQADLILSYTSARFR